MDQDEHSLYADMRAAVRADQERAAQRRAEEKRPDPVQTPVPETPRPRRFAGLRRLFGGQPDPS